jgi:hypothetical protein
MPPGAEKVVAANMMGPPELIEYSIIVFEAVTKKEAQSLLERRFCNGGVR